MFPLQAIYECDHCYYFSVATWTVEGYTPGHLEWSEAPDSGTSWHPIARKGEDFTDVPEAIASLATEATVCRNVDAFRAAVSMARTVLEATAKDQGFDTGNLVEKIGRLRDEGLVRPGVHEAADEIRLAGNSIAHGDPSGPVTLEECEEVLELMKDVLNEVYQAPQRRERARAAREKRLADGDRA